MLRPPFPVLISLLLSATLLAFPVARAAQGDSDGDIEIKVEVEGDNVHLDISALIAAKPPEVWTVMTDFDHMSAFISNLKSSRVIARSSPTSYMVEQHGRAGNGLFSFSLDSIRNIETKPFEWIRSRLLSGDMKKFDGVTRLSAEGDKTRVEYHSDAISSVWIPPFIGRSLIESEAREQFEEVFKEVRRRQQRATASR